ncbi:MAG TPA: cysteine desulfurase family protein [Candidatus Polarisedimenticolaceae bacterium]|nr:cysteine desulfurase family protein [Candidatus Polarisedimenticolaceae bacterium]
MLVYLDHNATTPLAPEVLEAVVRAQRDLWGNPSSPHALGLAARRALEEARAQVAALLSVAPEEVIFTSGGTESDNAAVLGVAEARPDRRHVVISAVEHAAVAEPARRLRERGWRVSVVPVLPSGVLDLEALGAALTADTALVSVIHAQNETGVLQPIAEVAARAHDVGAVVHTDAAQSVGKVPLDVPALGVDLLTVAGHKVYAPKGIGALIVRQGTPFRRVLEGAGHEGGRRAGTENVAGAVGLGVACALALREGEERGRRLAARRDRLERELRARFPDAVVHGSGAPRLPNTLSIALPGIEAWKLLADLRDVVAASAGAACHSSGAHVSPVLAAMGVPPELALGTLRFTTGKDTSEADVDAAVTAIAAWAQTRAMSASAKDPSSAGIQR